MLLEGVWGLVVAVVCAGSAMARRKKELPCKGGVRPETTTSLAEFLPS